MICVKVTPGSTRTCVWLAGGCAGCAPVPAVRVNTITAGGVVSVAWFEPDCVTPIVGASIDQELTGDAIPLAVTIVGGGGGAGPSADNETITLCNALGEPILVQYNVLVVPPVELSRFNLATGLVEPAGPLTQCATGTAPITFTDRTICATMADATVWELIERTSSLGAVAYLDPDTSPMTAPPVAFASILHSGACNCSDV